MKHFLLISMLCSIGAILLPGQTTLINFGDNWSYYDLGNEPAPTGGDTWKDINYNDGSWESGNAQLGYGDGDETTTLNSSTLTGYFRHSFTVANPAIFANLDLDLIYDDGAVVYLNGNEIWRVNMPGGTISYGTFSSTTSSDNEIAATSIPSNLITGTNVISVEIHQRSSGSSDISFDFKLAGLPPGAVSVERGPYLQKSSATSMTIKWRTNSATTSQVNYGTSLSNLNLSESDGNNKTEHEIEINGLSPSTVYFYDIGNTSQVFIPAAADQYFKTSPTIGDAQPLTAWILGDCGTANNNQRAVRDAYYNYIDSNHTDMILFLGDNAYNDGTDNEYQLAVFENMYEEKLKNTVSWSCLGNHDGHSANSNAQTGPYYDIFSFPKNGESGGLASGTEAYYSFDYGNVHFISLDSYETDRSVGGTMYTWCQADIQNTTADWIVAFWHHPPYTKGSHNSDSETNLIEMRQNFLPMLETNGVDLVLSGHSHSYERSYLLNGHYGNSGSFNTVTHTVGASGSGDGRIAGNGAYQKTTTGPTAGEGAVYITTGSSGKVTSAALNHNAMYYSVASLGSCVLEVNGNQMDVKFVRETNAIEDYFTIQKTIVTCTTGDPCDDSDDCTINDMYDASCNCSGTFQDTDSDGICDVNDQCPGQDDSLIGMSCNDNDTCSVNDIYDSNCNCAGTFQDTDNDGVCDALDQCPTLDDALIGSPCDDGLDCTSEDTWDTNCNCTGTFDDADNDGVCDALDQCPGQDDNLIGTSCNDNDVCTVNDTYDGNCNCAGTYLDSDSDGVCDADDQCPGQNDNLIGSSCNDNDSCTINDVYDNNCSCSGTFEDSDGDGVCDANDQCPGQNDALIGSACNDNDACTINDIYDNNCNCAGTYTDADGDGVCVGDDPDDNDGCVPDGNSPVCDPCTTIDSESFESDFGMWIDGGNDCARSASNANTGTYSVRLRDNSGQASSMYTANQNWSVYNVITVEFSFYANSMENNEDFFLEISTNGGSNYTIVSEWNRGVEFQNNIRYNESVEISGITFTTQTRLRFRCDASGNNDQIYIDDVIISSCSVSCNSGDPCDDGDNCTINDNYDSNCNCVGTFADDDNDGVCDALDQCPGLNDNIIGTSCDDGDNCTILDTYDNNCQCSGIYTDSDNDGFCVGVDPDDNDGCNPDSNSPACLPCNDIISDSFESGWGNWIDGGSDCSRISANANTGSLSVRLRDNSGASSSMSSAVLNLSSLAEVTVEFSFITSSMENGEDFFLEISTDGGSNFTIVQEWNSGTEFQNNTRYYESVLVSGFSLNNNTVFRLRCDASNNKDQVFIDDILVTTCSTSSFTAGSGTNRETIRILKAFPVPADNILNVVIEPFIKQATYLNIYNMRGQKILSSTIDKTSNRFSINTSSLQEGVYILVLEDENQRFDAQRVVIIH